MQQFTTKAGLPQPTGSLAEQGVAGGITAKCLATQEPGSTLRIVVQLRGLGVQRSVSLHFMHIGNGWLHGVCVGACWVVSPQGGFFVSIFCNYHRSGQFILFGRGLMSGHGMASGYAAPP